MKILIPLLLLTGCTTAELTYDADGEEALLVVCQTNAINLCHERAKRECGGPYKLLSQDLGGYMQSPTITVKCEGEALL